jgi:hypothetical protein
VPGCFNDLLCSANCTSDSDCVALFPPYPGIARCTLVLNACNITSAPERRCAGCVCWGC